MDIEKHIGVQLTLYVQKKWNADSDTGKKFADTVSSERGAPWAHKVLSRTGINNMLGVCVLLASSAWPTSTHQEDQSCTKRKFLQVKCTHFFAGREKHLSRGRCCITMPRA